MARQPRQHDIEAAREYVRQRLDAERSMQYNLQIIMREAAERVVAVCYAYVVNPRTLSYDTLPADAQRSVDDIMSWLRDAIEDYFTELALYCEDDDKATLLAFITRRTYGSTFGERLTEYLRRYRVELMVLVGAALMLGLSKSRAASTIGDNMRQPFANPELKAGISNVPSYGHGQTNSMYTALGRLTQFGISEAWMHARYVSDKKNGATGWYVMRSSAYPCDLCDSMQGYHADDTQLPPYHNSCVCVAVPVFPDENSEVI